MADANAHPYPSLDEAIADYKTFQKATKDGAALTDTTWEQLIDTNIKGDYIRAWRQYDVRLFLGLEKFCLSFLVSAEAIRSILL